VSVVPGGRGQFDVVVDGTTVFSKEHAGRFPDPGELGHLAG
jgi:predicted Rdx family selenoprotein